jgi:hypothetical protein
MPKELHHYVPRLVLKNFSAGKSLQIWVYDKATDRTFQTNIINVAAEKGFYDLEVDGAVLTLEPELANLETQAANILNALLGQKTLRVLNTSMRNILAVFLAVQFVRTKEYRLRFEHLGQSLIEALRARGASENGIATLTQGPQAISDGRLAGIKSIREVRDIVPHFLNKEWVLLETVSENPFYISDNPIVLHNSLNHRPYGNLGLSAHGIEIYMPISSTLCLGLWCPSIAQEYRTAYETLREYDQFAPRLADTFMQNARTTRAYCEGIVFGTPISVVANEVTRLNSLQVMYSSRFVYGEYENFSLVKRMIQDNEKYREGLKPTIS